MNLAGKAFFVFLIVTLVVYHLLRGRTWKYAALTVASWIFYALSSPGYLWVLLLLTAIDYFAALKIEANDEPNRRKRWLILSIVSNLGLLAAFKYSPFVAENTFSIARWLGLEAPDRAWELLLPLGISFHTFQGISYTVDVYRKQIRAVKNPLDYALFVAFFPQLAAGPIVRAVEFLPQMANPPRVTAEQIGDGLRLFVIGLFKKLFIADQLHALFVDPVFANPAAYEAGVLRWACVAWAVQIYCDFSGYTDIALGIAKWFGFELPPNFDLPYLATSIADFWRRWHLSLSTWLRDYLYFPLGGSKGSAFRTYFNLMVLFVLCGLWHGATWHWLAYGAMNGILMGAHRAFDRTVGNPPWRQSLIWKAIAWTATMYQLVIGLVLIRMTDWGTGTILLKSLIGIANPTSSGAAFQTVPVLVYPLLLLGMAGHLCAPLAKYLERLPSLRAVGYATASVLMVVLGPGVTKSFIYIAF